MGCDYSVKRKKPRAARLSVSSNGSNGLRLTVTSDILSLHATFSILERIEWAATSKRRLGNIERSDFQYPRTDRMGCDLAWGMCGKMPRLFQYPRTDRMGCDTSLSALSPRSLRLSVSSNGSNGLRLPAPPNPALAPGRLSVSSNGSNGLRRSTSASASASTSAFSILERIEWAATSQQNSRRSSS